MKESELRSELKRMISSLKGEIYGFVKVASEDDIRGQKDYYEKIMREYFKVKDLIFIPIPDLILVFESYTTDDGWKLIAIELKSFQPDRVKEGMRKAFREIGQPLRYHLMGFDTTVLWHVFDEEIDDELIKDYIALMDETIAKLSLPLEYYATKITEKGEFIYAKLITSRMDLKNLVRLFEKTLAYCKNPLIYEKKSNDVLRRREAIKLLLGIPGKRL